MVKRKNKITLISILKDSQYNLSIFTSEEITTLEKKIIEKKGKPYVECIKAKNIAKQSLNIAKRGVEMVIEKDEKQAQKWMDSELEKLNTK